MDIEELKRSIDKGTPVVVTETGEIVDPSANPSVEGEVFQQLRNSRWY